MRNRIVNELVELAKSSPAENHRVAAIITNKRGIPVSTGINQPSRTHPIQAWYAKSAGLADKVYLHAEMHSLIRNKSDDAHTMYVLRLGRGGQIRMARPCEICQTAILASEDIEEVYYSTDDTNKTGELTYMSLDNFDVY